MERETFGDWVRAARRHRNWTQAQLARAMGVTPPNVSHWENLHHRPSHDQLVRISRLTGYPLREVGAPIDWPLPHVPFQRLAGLAPEQLEALQVVMLSVLKAMENAPSYPAFIAALQPSPNAPSSTT